MANEEHLNVLNQGIVIWNQWRKQNPQIHPDLSGAHLFETDLHEADLSNTYLYQANLWEANVDRANLSGTHLSKANLNRANLNGANLIGADLSQADLSGAHLYQANLSQANLSGADLTGANLIEANFNRANLDGVNLREVRLGYTIFGNTNFGEVKELDTVFHEGPSTIGIDVIYLSKGNISPLFLEKAGVQPKFITYIEKIKIPKCQYTEEQLDGWISNLQKRLIIINKGLAHHQNQTAGYGPLSVPYSIQYEVDNAKAELEKIEAEITKWRQLKDLHY